MGCPLPRSQSLILIIVFLLGCRIPALPVTLLALCWGLLIHVIIIVRQDDLGSFGPLCRPGSLILACMPVLINCILCIKATKSYSLTSRICEISSSCHPEGGSRRDPCDIQVKTIIFFYSSSKQCLPGTNASPLAAKAEATAYLCLTATHISL